MPTLLAALVFSMSAPSVTAKTAPEAAAARQELRAAVEDLRRAPSLRGERRVTRAMARVDATIDTDRGAYERVRVVVDNLFAANARNQEEDFFKLDGHTLVSASTSAVLSSSTWRPSARALSW